MSAASILYTWEWVSIIGPLYITLILLFGSGIPTTEKSTDQRYWNNEEYQKYKKRTPVLVPFVPGLITGVAKIFLCCEWTCYNFPPEKKTEGESLV